MSKSGKHSGGQRQFLRCAALANRKYGRLHAIVAKGCGMYSEGPISDPAVLRPALERGIERVKKGQPVLLDVIAQPRG